MNVQHVNVKIFAVAGTNIRLGDAVPIFHRWIQERVPGVMLIGHEADYSLDNSFGELGLLYCRKVEMDVSFEDQLQLSFTSALAACRRLEDDPAFHSSLEFEAGHCEVILNDRLLTPNTEATWIELEPDFRHFFDRLFGSGTYQMALTGEPRERFRIAVQANASLSLAQASVALETALL